MQIGNFVNVVRRSVAIVAAGLAVVGTAADFALRPPVALDAALFVSQRLKITCFIVLSRDVGMAFVANNIRVCRRIEDHVFMTFGTINVLCLRSSDKQQNNRCYE
jgi:hypothetical protein